MVGEVGSSRGSSLCAECAWESILFCIYILYIWYLMLMVSSSLLLVGASVKLLSREVAASELSVGGIQRPFRQWRVTFTRPFSLLHLFGWCRWNVSGRLLFIWMGRRASDSGNGNQLLSTKRPKVVFHLRQHGDQEYLHIWCVMVRASHAGSSGALPEAFFSVFLACPCTIHCFEMIWNAASLSSPLPTGRTPHTATSVK